VNLRKFFAELKRRNVYKVAIAYAVIAWLLIQIATQTFPFFEVPNWIGAGCHEAKCVIRATADVVGQWGRWLHRLVRCFHSPLIDRMNPGRSSSRFYRIRKSRQMSLRVRPSRVVA
jgi:hypothetical protein